MDAVEATRSIKNPQELKDVIYISHPNAEKGDYQTYGVAWFIDGKPHYKEMHWTKFAPFTKKKWNF